MEIAEIGPDDARLEAIYPVMHELREDLTLEEFKRRYAEGHPDGYRMVGLLDEGEWRAVAGYRVLTNLVRGRVLYIDDLVTSARHRSKGYGHLLNRHLTDKAREQGCSYVTLDSGTARTKAHRFYFREGYVISSFHFRRRAE